MKKMLRNTAIEYYLLQSCFHLKLGGKGLRYVKTGFYLIYLLLTIIVSKTLLIMYYSQ